MLLPHEDKSQPWLGYSKQGVMGLLFDRGVWGFFKNLEDMPLGVRSQKDKHENNKSAGMLQGYGGGSKSRSR